jgi:hypothetical protein
VRIDHNLFRRDDEDVAILRNDHFDAHFFVEDAGVAEAFVDSSEDGMAITEDGEAIEDGGEGHCLSAIWRARFHASTP